MIYFKTNYRKEDFDGMKTEITRLLNNTKTKSFQEFNVGIKKKLTHFHVL